MLKNKKQKKLINESDTIRRKIKWERVGIDRSEFP